jgi:hypothetical protein
MMDAQAVGGGPPDTSGVLPLGRFYQFGFVTGDLDRALVLLRDRYGVHRVRRRRRGPALETAHAWTGATMIEVLAVTRAAPPLYSEYLPDDLGALRLHHLGRWIQTASAWRLLENAVQDAGLPVVHHGTTMDGSLHFMYIDTRSDLGIYSEYVWLEDGARSVYDDVPQNA